MKTQLKQTHEKQIYKQYFINHQRNRIIALLMMIMISIACALYVYGLFDEDIPSPSAFALVVPGAISLVVALFIFIYFFFKGRMVTPTKAAQKLLKELACLEKKVEKSDKDWEKIWSLKLQLQLLGYSITEK